MQQQDNHEYPFLYQRQTCHQVQPNQATYQKRQKCQPATYLQDRKSGSAGMPRPISYAVLSMKKKIGKDWYRYESHFVHARDSLVVILNELALLYESDAFQPIIFKKSCVNLLNLHSFPTRRSSDLAAR